MNEEKKEILRKNATEYFKSGESELKNKRYNSAVILFFKSLISSVDFFLIEKAGEAPSSHIDRFKKTKNDFSDIYDLIDKDFPFYQDSYSKNLTKELAEVIKDDARNMAQKTGIEL